MPVTASSLSSTSNHSGAIVGFSTKRGEQVNVRVASSFISPEQALLNLKELGDGGIDEEWDSYLSQLDAMGIQEILKIQKDAYAAYQTTMSES